MLKRLGLMLGTTLIALVGFAPAANAATINVTTTADDFAGATSATCSLREAVQAANTNSNLIAGSPGGCTAGEDGIIGSVTDTITIQAGTTYPLTRNGVDDTNSAGDLDIGNADDRVSLQSTGGGLGGTAITCSGCGDRVIQVSTPSPTSISGVRVSGGSAGAGGGGISSSTQLSLTNVTVSGNTAVGDGGGIFITGTGAAPLSLKNVTVTGNSTARRGGGLAYAASTNSFVENSTIVGNTGDTDESGSPEDVGGGIASFGAGVVNISNTILSENFIPGVDGGDECSANVTSGNNNILGDSGNCTSFTPGTNDLVGSFFGGEVRSFLGALGNYGGAVWTMQPERTSPAINRGYLSGAGTTCQNTDARGIARPQEARCDIGAVEVSAPGPQALAVTATDDQLNLSPAFNGPCSLREAITASNNNQATGGCPAGTTATDTINLAPGTYTLTRVGNDDTNLTGDLDLLSSDTVNIFATGPGQTTIDGNGLVTNDRVLQASSNVFGFINGVNIQNGRSIANGGGVQTAGELYLDNVTVSGNFATGDGGGVHYTNSVFGHIENSTISGNQANGNGGGMSSADGFFPRVRNVTVTGNTADLNATGAEGGGGLSGFAGFQISNTIVAGNTDVSNGDAPDCNTGVGHSTLGYNLIGNADNCNLAPGAGDQVGSNAAPISAGLGGLANNGGRTLTHAPLLGSLVLNAGNPAAPGLAPACAPIDQIGTVRPLGGRCDIGALEASPSATTVPLVPTTPAPATTPATGPTGQRAAALKKCKKKPPRRRAACKKRANKLPV
jgi:CSLREA domain-containing protein